jgi:DME family drug/metabolite transporter
MSKQNPADGFVADAKPQAAGALPFSLAHGRLCIFLAALLWSTSGGFTKLLTQDTPLNLHVPLLEPYRVEGLSLPVQIAFYRVLFAGLVLVPTLGKGDYSWRGLLIVSALCFATMNITFISAQALGPAANAILLQYSAPLWMYLASIWWLGEQPDRRSTLALAAGMVGIGIIIWGGWQGEQVPVIALALVSGLAYGGVLICLRVLRGVSSRWLTVWNHLWGALVLLPLVWSLQAPTIEQFIVLFLFGTLQMALPYWLVARGLRVVSPQEAGAITLLEPILNPVWAYLVSPKTETPPLTTYVGGAIILGALAWRYWPRK